MIAVLVAMEWGMGMGRRSMAHGAGESQRHTFVVEFVRVEAFAE